MEKYAHKRDDGVFQTLREHLNNTADRAAENAVSLFKPLAHAVGLAHDIGKYSEAFQARLNGSTKRFEHSVCGAMEYREILEADKKSLNYFFAPLIEFCIACHHTGLQDGGSKRAAETAPDPESRMNSRISEKRKREYTGKCDYSEYKNEITLEKPDFSELFKIVSSEKNKTDIIELYAFFTRYLFSCLVDADFIDTERFCAPEKERGFSADLAAASRNLSEKLSSLKAETELQKARSRIQDQAYKNAENDSQINILNMPTGSGKTYCSLKLALDKLNSDKTKKRVIYVIPYTGIIEQTAKNFEDIFKGCAPILQHHSNYSYEESAEYADPETTSDKLRRACENWDAPVIITTAVQFFESVCHYRTSALRKLHNIANSIIVFDEIHTLPTDCLQPCLRAVGYITKHLNSEAVFLSATMPDYSELFKKYAPDCIINHLITDKADFDLFKRADFVDLGKTDLETVAERSAHFESSLIVMNSRRSAREMYGMISGNKYHLSAYMTPIDREKTLAKIKEDLENHKKITVVSTSLIEAGIDLDFETVFRELNGLDSVLQAGGRCNREGKRDKGTVYIFETENSTLKNEPRINTAKRLLKKYDDIFAPECIEEYYNDIFCFKSDTIAGNTIAANTPDPFEINFKSFAEQFKLIKDESIGVVIPPDNKFSEELQNRELISGAERRKLQKYTVSLKCRGGSSEFARALKQGVITQTRSGVFVLIRSDNYDPETGLDVDRSGDIVF